MELELINRDTRELVSGAHEILGEMNAPHGEAGHPKAKKELLQSTVEIITGICETAADIKADLAATMAELREHTERRNLEIICSGTHPFSDPALQEISPDPRYLRLVNDMQWPAKQMQIFGIHVHVGVRSGEKAIAMVNALSAYIPHFLALSASSPYWMGHDTGMDPQRLAAVRAVDGHAHLVAHHQDDPRGVVGYPSAPELRHRRDPRL
jgi:carboxylate-amine ligase